MAGGRAVDDDQVPVAAALELLDLAEHDDVVDARARPWRRRRSRRSLLSRLAIRPKPCSRRYSSSASGAAIASTSRSRHQLGEHRLAVELDDEHAEPGVGDAARARTAVTVVLPTPPLPATTTTRAAVNDAARSTLSGGTFAQTSDRPARRPRWHRAWSARLALAQGDDPPVDRPRRPPDEPPARQPTRRSTSPGSTCCRSAGCSTRSSSTRSRRDRARRRRAAPRR